MEMGGGKQGRLTARKRVRVLARIDIELREWWVACSESVHVHQG